MKVFCSVSHSSAANENGILVPCVEATCPRCGRSEQAWGDHDASVKRALITLKQTCACRSSDFYVERSSTYGYKEGYGSVLGDDQDGYYQNYPDDDQPPTFKLGCRSPLPRPRCVIVDMSRILQGSVKQVLYEFPDHVRVQEAFLYLDQMRDVIAKKFYCPARFLMIAYEPRRPVAAMQEWVEP